MDLVLDVRWVTCVHVAISVCPGGVLQGGSIALET